MRRLARDGAITDILAPYAAVDRTTGAGGYWVLANMVGGLDGTASVGGRVGELSDATDHQLFLALRSLSDVVLVGAETVRRERYGPVSVPSETREERFLQGRRSGPTVAVVTRSLELDWDSALFRAAELDSRTIVLTCAAADLRRRARASEVADVIVAGEDRVDLTVALPQLATYGRGVILCEGGPTLLGELAALDLLDELCLTLSPVLGGDPLPVAVTPAGAPITRLRLADTLVEAGTLYLRYQR